ncbi:carboxymuconolactone decarboxylase family protein [Paeniglutamicibacter psychrophenolicus]|uniref:carboxymuconolactone decarboxylase family protein n=1 Tax=Paeniglutamicibacter psychrophenolicus TaxID=257454 RepID=UPI002788C4C2|nr:carboxymuconolactone decarboxylase family protein [Paeniglutamicibacter psychrophenolicus]MDQ0094750.1 putative peroxidase-related enzyme [Paeniglutamicibacter psychrophenolicus]
MGILQTTSEAEAVGATAAAYAADRAALGYVPSHTKVLALNPEAFEAWKALQSSIAKSMGMRRYELVTLAAALGIGSRHCRLAHGNKALKYIDEQELLGIARDYRSAALTEAEVAMMDYAVKLSGDSAAMDESDSRRLRDLGFPDREIVDITLAAAARNYLSRILQALAVDIDVPPQLSDDMRGALLDPIEARKAAAG